MRKEKCPFCKSEKVKKKGVRRGAKRYVCKECKKWFQLNRKRLPNKRKMLLEHLDGSSFRSLAERHNISIGTAYNWCQEELEKLPQCIDVTREYCNRFCGHLEVDGKFVKVKGYKRKIPVIYGIDYQTHDIPHFLLSTGENYESCIKFFQSLRLANYPLEALICDDNKSISLACKNVYPKTVVQLCQNHYKENIRKSLDTRKDTKYQLFMLSIEHLMSKKRSLQERNSIARKILKKFGNEATCLAYMADLQKRSTELFANDYVKKLPTTTNLIESYNSHLQGRLETIKGFESFQHADLWLNAYFLRRRTKKFTDCTGKFKHLNGKTALKKSLKRGIDTPTFFD